MDRLARVLPAPAVPPGMDQWYLAVLVHQPLGLQRGAFRPQPTAQAAFQRCFLLAPLLLICQPPPWRARSPLAELVSLLRSSVLSPEAACWLWGLPPPPLPSLQPR